MFPIEKLDNAFNSALSIVNFRGGFDTFQFRKGFENEFNLTEDEKNEILDYLNRKLRKGNNIYQLVKNQINQSEFLTTAYYANPTYPRRFRGAYHPVIMRTFGGAMALSL